MNERDLFWREIDRALDQRLDPLADPRIQAHLASEPELLDEYSRLRATLDRVQTAGPQIPAKTRSAAAHPLLDRRFTLLPAAAALALIGWIARTPGPSEEPDSALAGHDAPGAVLLLEYSVEITTRGPLGSTGSSFRLEDGTLRRRLFAERGKPPHRVPSPVTPALLLSSFTFSETDR